jgi:threonine/homoserine/homoserine lactone efflux protein
MAVTLGNPKIMMFYLALLPTIIDLNSVTVFGWAELTITMVLVLIAVDVAWAAAASQARRLLRSARAMKIANRISAGTMAGAAAAIAARS